MLAKNICEIHAVKNPKRGSSTNVVYLVKKCTIIIVTYKCPKWNIFKRSHLIYYHVSLILFLRMVLIFKGEVAWFFVERCVFIKEVFFRVVIRMVSSSKMAINQECVIGKCVIWLYLRNGPLRGPFPCPSGVGGIKNHGKTNGTTHGKTHGKSVGRTDICRTDRHLLDGQTSVWRTDIFRTDGHIQTPWKNIVH